MAQLSFGDIFEKMLEAAKGQLENHWPTIKDLATSSIKTLAQNIVDIERMEEDGTITEEQAKLKLQLQKDAFKILLLTNEAIGLLIVEAALNAALNAIKEIVNTAIGFVLI